MFGSPIYDAEVLENSPAGTPIINVTAIDADKGMFGIVAYSLAGLCFSVFDDFEYTVTLHLALTIFTYQGLCSLCFFSISLLVSPSLLY